MTSSIGEGGGWGLMTFDDMRGEWRLKNGWKCDDVIYGRPLTCVANTIIVIVADLLMVIVYLLIVKMLHYTMLLCLTFSSILILIGNCDISNCQLVFGGDFNFDLASNYPDCHVWNDMMTNLNLIICDLACFQSLNQCFSRYLEFFRYCYRCW